MSIFLDRETLGASAMSTGPLSTKPHGSQRRSRFASVWAIAKVLGGIVSSSIFLLVCLFLVERFASEEWRPSTLLGTFAGEEHAAASLTAIEAKRAEAAVVAEKQAGQQATVRPQQP